MPTSYGDRPSFPRTRRRRKGLSLKVALISVGVVIVVCGLALCGMNLSDPPRKADSGSQQQTGSEQQGGDGGAGAPPPTGQSGSSAPQPVPTNSAVVPDLVGLNAAVAGDQLKHLGFKNVEYASGDKRYKIVIVPQNWSVTKQSAAAGTRLAKDTLIVLTCVKPN